MPQHWACLRTLWVRQRHAASLEIPPRDSRPCPVAWPPAVSPQESWHFPPRPKTEHRKPPASASADRLPDRQCPVRARDTANPTHSLLHRKHACAMLLNCVRKPSRARHPRPPLCGTESEPSSSWPGLVKARADVPQRDR